MEEPDETDLELEALSLVYPGRVVASRSKGQVTVEIQILPRNAENHEIYAQLTLQLKACSNYPEGEDSMNIAILGAKGLDDMEIQSALSELEEEKQSLSGELIMGHLCEYCIDIVERYNTPRGECAFCLESFEKTEERKVVKLACFHMFHLDCFKPWFCWKQRKLRAREIEILEEYKTSVMAKEIMEQEGIKRDTTGTESKEHGQTTLYQVNCPCCRTGFACLDVAVHLQDNMQSFFDDKYASQEEALPDELATVASLPETLRRSVLGNQQRFQQILEIQSRNNGLITSAKTNLIN
eukprot:jgi/Picsp_1/3154/NSC_05994-R1_rwd domain containing expressed